MVVVTCLSNTVDWSAGWGRLSSLAHILEELVWSWEYKIKIKETPALHQRMVYLMLGRRGGHNGLVNHASFHKTVWMTVVHFLRLRTKYRKWL